MRSLGKRRRVKSDLFQKINGITVFTGKVPKGFDFEIFREEERFRRDLQIGVCITPEEADLLFPGTQPFVPHKPLK